MTRPTHLSLAAGLLLLLGSACAEAQVRPTRPAAHDDVSVRIPYASGGGCRIETTIRKKTGRGRTVIEASAQTVGRCRRHFGAGETWASVGALKAGVYELVTSAGRHRFVVRPRGQAAPENQRRLRSEIAKRYDFAACPPPEKKESKHSVLRRRARSITLTHVTGSTWRYRFVDGCEGPAWTGSATAAPRLLIGPRQVDKQAARR